MATTETSSGSTRPTVRPGAGKRRPGGPRPLRWLGYLLGVLILAIVIFLALFNWDWFRPPLAKLLSARLHRPVRIVGHLKVHLFSWTPTATLQGLRIGEPDWGPKPDMADVDAITVRLKLLSIFTGDIVLPLIEIDHPQVDLFQDKSGRANWDFSNGKAPGKPAKLPAIQNFVVRNGELDVTSLQRKLKFAGKVNADERANSSGEGFAMTGTGSLNAKPFQMNVTGGPLLNVRPNVPYPFDVIVSAGDIRVTAKGRVPHPFNLGEIDAGVSLSGHDLADLYYLTGITLPNTPPYSISGQLTRVNMVYDFDRFTGRVGGSDLEGDLKADMRNHDRPNVTARLRSKLLDFKDLGALFGASGKNAPAKPRVALTKAAPTTTASRMLLPDAPLDVERVRGMDAEVTYDAQSVRAPGLPLRQVKLGVKLDHGKLTLNPIDLVFPQGRLSGNATLDASGPVQKDAVDLRVSNVKMQNFLPKAKGAAGPPPLEGTLDARAKLTATGNSVHKAASSADGRVVAVIPGGVIRQAFAELLGIDASKGLFELLSKDQKQTDIRCAVADFRVRDGQFQVNQIVLDTGVVLLNGAGDINLRDESINLSLKGKPKQFRLVRINAPINITGRLTSPKIGVNVTGAAVQTGVATALAAAVNPALLLLPFIDLGLNKNADCAALVSGAQAMGAPVKVRSTSPPAARRPA